MTDTLAFFDDDPQEEEIKSEKTDIFDTITLLTELKKYSEVIENGSLFWGYYSHTKSKAGRIYKNLVRVYFNNDNLPPTEMRDDGTGTEIILKQFCYESLRFLLKYLSYSSECFMTVYKYQNLIALPPHNIYLMLEKDLPKKKLYIKNMRKKTEVPEEYIEEVRQYFNVSKRKANEYVELIDECGKLDEFREIFGGNNERKKGKK